MEIQLTYDEATLRELLAKEARTFLLLTSPKTPLDKVDVKVSFSVTEIGDARDRKIGESISASVKITVRE